MLTASETNAFLQALEDRVRCLRVVVTPSESKKPVLNIKKGLHFTLQFISMPCLQPQGRGKREEGGEAAKHTRWKTSLPRLAVMNNFKGPRRKGKELVEQQAPGLTI